MDLERFVEFLELERLLEGATTCCRVGPEIVCESGTEETANEVAVWHEFLPFLPSTGRDAKDSLGGRAEEEAALVAARDCLPAVSRRALPTGLLLEDMYMCDV